MVEDLRVEKKLSWVERADVEEVRNHRVDGQCLPGAPGNGRRVILSCAGRVHFCLRERFQEVSRVDNEGGELRVIVCQGPIRIPV